MSKLIVSFILIISLAFPARAGTLEESLSQSRRLAENKEYDKALALLEDEEKHHPDNVELKLAIIRILGWQGNYDQAEAILASLDRKHKNNADVMLLKATLSYYRSDYQAAKRIYQDILAAHPEYDDARTGLERVEKIMAEPIKKPLWQFDTGHETSRFSRRPQPDWNQEFIQLTRFLNDRKTSLYGKLTRYDQFTNIDSEYEAGIGHRFSDKLNAYAFAALVPNADFRPEQRLAAGGMWRVTGDNNNLFPIWLTVDARYDFYDTSKVLSLNPGLKLEPLEGWMFAARSITVDQQDAKRVYGEDFRLDGTLTDGLRFYLGYADAPETVAAITVDTRSWFTGITWDASDKTTIRLGFTHDDRENSYTRKAVNVSFGYRF